jgi:hypothetical protein
MEANEVGHELPSLRVRRFWIRNERSFEGGLRALPFFTFGLASIFSFRLSGYMPARTTAVVTNWNGSAARR